MKLTKLFTCCAKVMFFSHKVWLDKFPLFPTQMMVFDKCVNNPFIVFINQIYTEPWVLTARNYQTFTNNILLNRKQQKQNYPLTKWWQKKTKNYDKKNSVFYLVILGLLEKYISLFHLLRGKLKLPGMWMSSKLSCISKQTLPSFSP